MRLAISYFPPHASITLLHPPPPTPEPSPVPILGTSLPATVSNYEGPPVTVTAIDRIVALNGDITEIMVALGLVHNLGGGGLSATYPPESEP